MRQCTDCRRLLDDSEFHWVPRASGTRRGRCKNCMRLRKLEQRSPDWTPACSRCAVRLPTRTGSGRRLRAACFAQTYAVEDPRHNGAHRLRLRPCTLCGGPKERFERGKVCGTCRPWVTYAKSLRRFGLTPRDYLALLAAQGGVCFICGEVPGDERLRIDHDHALPEGRAAVRGLLCNDCNYSRSPRVNESVDMLQRAIEYLIHPPARGVLSPFSAERTHEPEVASRPGEPPVGSQRRPGRSRSTRGTGRISGSRRHETAGEADG